jgi:hypothetical protein
VSLAPVAAAPVPVSLARSTAAPVPVSLARSTVPLALAPVPFLGALTLTATVVPPTLRGREEIFAAISDGGLHYIPRWKHFAVRVGGLVLHARPGRIYPTSPGRQNHPRPKPERIKECRRGGCRGGGGCLYYHDPEEFEGSTDARNFMADAWAYTPALAPAYQGARRLGSADNFEADLYTLTPEDSRRFFHQVAHDLVCAMALWQWQQRQ